MSAADPALPAGVPGPGLMELAAFDATASPGFAGWLRTQRIALAITTGNRLMLVGTGRDGELRIRERRLESAAGLAAADAQTLHVATRWQLLRLVNALAEGEVDESGHDRLYLVQTAHTTGFVGAYDVAVRADGSPMFTSALCNCVATEAERVNFTAVWRPPFVSTLVGEDRAHVTGLTLDEDREDLAYVTCAAQSDVEGGWRDGIASGGVVVDAQAGEVLTTGLSLPHSPRLHRGRLFVAAAGTGELHAVDRETGDTEVVARVPGLARGLAFAGRYAVLGCSQVKDDGPYASAPNASLPKEAQRHGVVVVDLETGAVTHRLFVQGASGEVFGMVVLADTVYPDAPEPGGLREQLALGPVARVRLG